MLARGSAAADTMPSTWPDDRDGGDRREAPWWRRLWEYLIEPAAGVREVADRQRARLLRALLLIAFPLGVVSVTVHLVTWPTVDVARAAWLAALLTIVLISWILSATRHFQAGAALLTAVFFLGPWMVAATEHDAIRAVTVAMLPVIAVFLSAIFFSMPTTLFVGGAHLLASVGLALTHPALNRSEAVPFLTAAVFLLLIVLTASATLRRVLRALEGHARDLETREERYELATRGGTEGVWDWNPATGEAWFSAECYALMGGRPPEPGSADLGTWLGRVHDDDVDRVRDALAQHAVGRSASFEAVHRVRGRDGELRWLVARGQAIRDDTGRAVRMAGILSDITRQKEAEDRLRHDAFHDTLTGVANRALFEDRLRQALARSDRLSSAQWAVLFVDLDHFKRINDTLGHEAGDRFLTDVAHRLSGCVRPADTVARLGGDEFAVLLDQLAGPEDAELIAQRIQEALQEPFEYRGQRVHGSASIGIAPGRLDYETMSAVLRDADRAMYQAKSEGRGCYRIFGLRTPQPPEHEQITEAELRRALDLGELRLRYQPVVGLLAGRIVGFEALVRWEHPTRGLLEPEQFLPIAERSGLIDDLDRWVLERASRDAGAWQRLAIGTRPTLFVNLSGHDLQDPTFAAWLLEVLADTDLAPEDLRLDLTESAAMGDMPGAEPTLSTLREAGVRLCIDHFGTWYTSLPRLSDLSCDTLKMDRSLLRTLDEGVRAEVVEAMVALSHSLHLAVAAEGVETEAQLARLRKLGVDLAQGYLFSPPVESEAAADLIARNPGW
ncbi:MAG: putative bifunctional diguanylate cyclase/phosphodiesterase [Myxococcota bacterium]